MNKFLTILIGIVIAGCSTSLPLTEVPIPNSVRTRLLPDCQKQEYAVQMPRDEYVLLQAKHETTCEIVDGDYLYFIRKELVGGDGPSGEWSGVKLLGVFRTTRK